VKLVEDKLSTLENEVRNMNNGNGIIQELGQLIKNKIMAAIDEANSAESIEERVKILVAGYQEVLNSITDYQNKFVAEVYTRQTKISVLEEVMDTYIANEGHDLDEE